MPITRDVSSRQRPTTLGNLQKKFVTAAIKFALRTYGINVNVLVKRQSIIAQNGINYDIAGSAIQRAPGKYQVRIKTERGIRHAMHTLFHELAHVKQYTKNQLNREFIKTDDFTINSSYGEAWIIWMGKPYMKLSDYILTKGTSEYNALPWEEDANKEATRLYKLFLKSPEYNKLIDKHKEIEFGISINNMFTSYNY